MLNWEMDLESPRKASRLPSFNLTSVAFGIVLVLMLSCAIARWDLWSYGADTGIFAQATWNMTSGFSDWPEAGPHLRYHWSPIIGLLTPALHLIRSGLLLQFIQVFLILGASLSFYTFVRRYADQWLANVACLIALIYAPLLSIAFEEFHELAFYPLLAIWSIEAADRRAWKTFSILLLGLLLIREDVLLIVACTGAFLMLLGTNRVRTTLGSSMCGDRSVAWAGLGMALASMGVFIGYFDFVIPSLGGWAPSHFYLYPFSTGPLSLIWAIISNPLNALKVFSFQKFTYLLEAFVPLALLPFRSIWAVICIPGLAVILLANNGVVWRMGGHYSALWIPWALFATVDTLLRLKKEGKLRAVAIYARTILAMCLLVLLAFNPMHLAHYLRAVPHRLEASEALAIVPHDARVLLEAEWYAHFALEYPNSTTYLWNSFDWAVIDEEYPNEDFRTIWMPAIMKDVRAGRLSVVKRFGSVVVLRRKPSKLSRDSPYDRPIRAAAGRFWQFPVASVSRAVGPSTK